MFLLSDGLYISPMPFIWTQILAFASRDRDDLPRRPGFFGRTARRVRPSPERRCEDGRECSLQAAYQMGCLAQQMSVGGFDAGSGFRCGCEGGLGHCIGRMR